MAVSGQFMVHDESFPYLFSIFMNLGCHTTVQCSGTFLQGVLKNDHANIQAA
jgi:hypothetical protein